VEEGGSKKTAGTSGVIMDNKNLKDEDDNEEDAASQTPQ